MVSPVFLSHVISMRANFHPGPQGHRSCMATYWIVVMMEVIMEALVMRDGLKIRQPFSNGEFLQERPNIIHLLVSREWFQGRGVFWHGGAVAVSMDHARRMDIVQ